MLKTFADKMLNMFNDSTKEERKKNKYLAKIIAIGVYVDHNIHQSEIQEVERIVYECASHEKQRKYILKCVERFIKEYKKSEKRLSEDRSEIVDAIINTRNEEMENLIIRIFKADGIIAFNEKEIIESLESFFEYRRIMSKKIRDKLESRPAAS